MTDTELLRNMISKSGYKMTYVAEKIGLSYQGFLNKLKCETEFNVSEIRALCNLLRISKDDRDRIFFAD